MWDLAKSAQSGFNIPEKKELGFIGISFHTEEDEEKLKEKIQKLHWPFPVISTLVDDAHFGEFQTVTT